jgi:hypothetical protein
MKKIQWVLRSIILIGDDFNMGVKLNKAGDHELNNLI